MTTLYNYDTDGVYLGSSQANKDPLETQLQGEDVWLIPANATTTIVPSEEEPPVNLGQDEVWVWDMVDTWVATKDYRGQTQYEQIAPYGSELVEDLGELQANWGLVAPVITSPNHSTITAASNSLAGDGVANTSITVQVKNSNDENLTSGGDTVTLAANLGSLSAVTDNGDGTYSATYTSTTITGTAMITGTINADTIGSFEEITLT